MAKARYPPALELDGLSPGEAFAVLGNETRLAIIRALWEVGAHQEFDDIDPSDRSVSFSDLRRAVDVSDNGRFNYHLSRLIPFFVCHTEEGYRLSGAGRKIARTVVAISGEGGLDDLVEPRLPCPFCETPLSAGYEDGWLRFTCSECPGEFGDSAPRGTIYRAPFPRAGLVDRTADDALRAGVFRCMLDLTYLMGGICRECTSPVTRSASVCEDHHVTETHRCLACGTFDQVWGELRCGTCRFAKRLPIELCVMGLTPVIAFLYDRGVDVMSPGWADPAEAGVGMETTVTEDARRITVTLVDDDGELTVTLDDELAVVDVAAGSA